MALDANGNEIEDTGTASATDDGSTGVSERSEREIEAGADGASKTLEGDDATDADEALEALGEADPKRAVAGLRKRLAKLTAQRNSARADAAERNALAARVKAYEKRERDEEAKRVADQRNTPEGQKAEERRAAVRRTIDEAYGPGASEYLDEVREERQHRAEAYAQQGISYLRKELEDHGIVVTPETLVRYERAVGSEMAEDAQLLAAFRRPATQEAAIQDAFTRVRDGIVNPVLKQSGAKALARIDRNREAVLGSGGRTSSLAGTPEPDRDLSPPKDYKGNLDDYWREVKEREWSRLSAAERSQ